MNLLALATVILIANSDPLAGSPPVDNDLPGSAPAAPADREPPPLPPPAGGLEATAAAPAAPLAGARLSGVVNDTRTGAPLEGILVLVDGQTVATTDEKGEFAAAELPAGDHLLTLAGPSGEELHQEIKLGAGKTLRRNFRLRAGDMASLSLVERSSRPRKEAGEVRLSQQEVASVPGTFGDPVRVIENLPGTSRAPGGVGGALIIRGANPEDSAVLIDGVQIPLLYHFGGLTSVVNSEFLSAVTFMPGGFGAQYGRATGGVAEVQSAPMNCDPLRASASVDVLDAEAFTCLKLGSWRVAAAARRSYIDAFLPKLMEAGAEEGSNPVVVSPSYFDYQLKAERAERRWRLELFAFGSHDALEVSRASSAEDVDLAVGGTLAFHRFQVRHLYFGDRVTLESSLTPGVITQGFDEGSADVGSDHHSAANIYTVQWRETATVPLGERLTLRGGIDNVLTHWNADFVTELPNLTRRYPSPLEVDVRDHNRWNHADTSIEQAYWSEVSWRALPGLTVTPGLRLSHLVFDTTRRLVLEPRLGTRWQASDDTTFTAASGIYHKLPEIMSGVLVDGFGQPALKAERALHLTTGVEQRLGPLETKLEGFYVRRDRLPSPTSEVEVKDGKAAPVLFKSDGRGRSYGAEVMLRLPATDGRRYSGWVAYTLSRSTRVDRSPDGQGLDQYESLDPGTPRLAMLPQQSREYLSPFDQTHILTAVGRRELPWNMSLGFRFQLVTGNPTSPLERGDAFYDADSDQYKVRAGSVARNSGRLPTFHRLDLRVDKRWQFQRWALTAYLELMNAYNERPVEAFGYDYRYRTRTPLEGLPILPLLGIKGEI